MQPHLVETVCKQTEKWMSQECAGQFQGYSGFSKPITNWKICVRNLDLNWACVSVGALLEYTRCAGGMLVKGAGRNEIGKTGKTVFPKMRLWRNT